MLPIIFRGHDEAGFLAHALGLSPDHSLVTVLSDNQRTPEARYACIIVVKDYFRMHAHVKDGGEWHYSMIEPAILEDVRAARAILVFDLCNEGPDRRQSLTSRAVRLVGAESANRGLSAGTCRRAL
jgi:hypothetical protein